MADNRTIWFAAVVQEREKMQMLVLHWLIEHNTDFKTIWIKHDKDKKPKIQDGETIEETNGENDDGCVIDENGIILPHFHILLKVGEKISPKGLSGSFGRYVNFQRCSSPRSYFSYLTHRSFRASLDENKFTYPLSDLQTNDDDFLKTFLTGSVQEMDLERRVIELITSTGSVNAALQLAINGQEWDVFREIKSHSYFYSKFFQ